MSLTTLNAYQQGGPVLDKLKSLWARTRSRADDPDLAYMAGSMAPYTGELSDLVEIGAGLQDRDVGRIGLGLGALALPLVSAPVLKKVLKRRRKKLPEKTLEQLETLRGNPKYRLAKGVIDRELPPVLRLDQQVIATKHGGSPFLQSFGALQPLKIRSSHSTPHLEWPVYGRPPISHDRKALDRMRPKLEAIPGERNAYINVITGEKFYVDPYTKELFDYLPMDEASVAKRIKAQGYGEFLHGTKNIEDLRSVGLAPDVPFFQVDNPDIAHTYAFSGPSNGKDWGVSPRSGFPGIEKVYSRSPNQLVFDARGHSWLDMPTKNIRSAVAPDRLGEFDEALSSLAASEFEGITPSALDTHQLNSLMRRMGYSGWDAYNLRDASQAVKRPTGLSWDVPSFVRSTVDPGLVRFEGAKFDPRALGFPSQFAGIAGLLGARYMSNALREDQR